MVLPPALGTEPFFSCCRFPLKLCLPFLITLSRYSHTQFYPRTPFSLSQQSVTFITPFSNKNQKSMCAFLCPFLSIILYTPWGKKGDMSPCLPFNQHWALLLAHSGDERSAKWMNECVSFISCICKLEKISFTL